ncbi:MAG: asparagine synthase-related protein, partial [Marinirhabdus sp.]|nr:asparagine synthase-related protein [Marinirhabdus sp.]
PYFSWYNQPRNISFDTALDEFTTLFETIINEQVTDKKVILPLSGGLDSRTQATAIYVLGKDVHAYSYKFKGGYAETRIGKEIGEACNFPFEEFEVEQGYLWDNIETLANINQCYSEFTHPRQMAFFEEYERMGEIFSLGHWGDVLFDGTADLDLTEEQQLNYLLKKIIKKGGMELATALWNAWQLPGEFESYLRDRVASLLGKIDITHASARLRAFKSLYWAPRWTATNLAIFAEQKPITLPYFDDRMCQFICTLPEAFLENRQLQIAYIKKRNRELAHITWEENKPYDLYSFHKNVSPNNLPYRILQKLKRETRRAMGNPYIQRNWELQFVGAENEAQLRSYLFNEKLGELVPETIVKHFYECFTKVDAVRYSHPVSMLLTLSLKIKSF